MKGKKSDNNNLIYCCIFLFSVFAITCILTSLTPLIADDYNYAFSWADHSRVDNLVNVIKSMRSHRQWTHGRVFAQGWVTIFMMRPKWHFSVANGAVVTAFFATLYHYFKRTNIKNPVFACALVSMLYWICMPVFGQVFLWLDGACNYFWGAALAWIVIELEQSSRNRSKKWVWMTVLFPMSFVGGAWSEHISFAMLTILFLFVVRFWITDHRIPLFDFITFLAGVAGYLFLMFSPSMLPTILKYRAIKVVGSHLQTLMRIVVNHWWFLLLIVVFVFTLGLWLKRMPDPRTRWSALSMMACGICLLLYLLLAIRVLVEKGICELISSTQTSFLMLLICFLYVFGRSIFQRVKRETIVEAIILSIGGFSALALFALAMYIPARGFCAPIIFIGIATAKLWGALEQNTSTAVRKALIGVFLVCFAFGFVDILHVSQAASKRNRAIEQALQSNGVLVATPYPVKTKYSAQYGLLDLLDGESWPNEIIQEYYGLKDIIVTSDT